MTGPALKRQASGVDVALEAEQAVLGGLLLNNASFGVVAAILSEGDFRESVNAAIYRAIRVMHGRAEAVDLVTICDHLNRSGAGQLKAAGGASYIASLAQHVPSALNIRRYAELVREAAVSRRLHSVDQDVEIPPEAEDSLALAFTRKHSKDWKYCAIWGRWLEWDGTRFSPDETLKSFDCSRDICRDFARVAPKGRDKIAAAKTVAAVERLARADRAHAVTSAQFDADPLLLNTPGGTLDLRTCELRQHRREDWLTKRTNVAPEAGAAHLWLEVLRRVTGGDGQLEAYLQRLFGYSLTGLTKEHAFAFLYGSGANGKSTVLNTITGILGDYAGVASADTFIESSGERHSTDVAALRGLRLLTAQETDEGRKWDAPKIKALTGGDAITARFMRQDNFTYVPQFKLLIAGNHKPGLRNVDEGIARRLHIVPFTQTIPVAERDPDLLVKLRDEWGQILAWALEGCAEWQLGGLSPPSAVLDATAKYLSSEDVFAHWLEECCLRELNARETVGGLYKSYRAWAERAGERELGSRRFSQALEERGLERLKLSGGTRGFAGLRLKLPAETGQGGAP